MNKWGKKLQKELDKDFSEEQQDLIEWYTDFETPEAYYWDFVFEGRKYSWNIFKATNKIDKYVEVK